MRRRRPRPIGPLAVSVAAVAAIAVLLWVGSLAVRGREAQQHLEAARAALGGKGGLGDLSAGSTGDPATALTQLASACAETTRADGLLRDVGGQMQAVMPLVQALQSAPVVGARTRAQTAALEAGTQLAAAGVALCTGAQPLVGLLSGSDADAGVGPDSARAAFQSMLSARPQLGEAADRLDRTLQVLAGVDDGDLDESARANLESLRARLPALVQTLRDATTLLDLVGGSGERQFLLVSQNPDELRATGGYIGSAGVVSVTNGTLRLLEYGSSRAYDTPPNARAATPRPFNKYLGEYWEFAGANWWANYPDVARQLAYFYSVARPHNHIDGVVALDQLGLRSLLEVLGPVDVPEYSERVGPADLQTALDSHVHAGDGYDELGRKQFTAALSSAVLQKLLSAPKAAVPGLVRAVQRDLDQQHLLVSVWDAGAADLLARHHWDGSLLPVTQDGLMVVDTDVVSSKQGQAVTRDVAYQVDLENSSGPLATTRITYANGSQPQPNVQYIDPYATFVRVYAPGGATLVSSDGFSGAVSQGQECGRSVFGGEVRIPRGASTQVAVSYRLPAAVLAGDGYDLLVQQQPGVPPGGVSVLINGSGGVRAGADVRASPGVNYRWHLGATENARLQTLPLPEPRAGGCSVPLVEAVPIAAPTHLEIPSANISAPVVELGVEPDGSMDPPPSPDVVGWYRMSARPGQPGNSVLAGHVDWGQNTAVFWGLRRLHAADSIILQGADGAQHRYLVEWNRVYARTDVSATQLVGGSTDAILTLITCDGTYDRAAHDYSDRRIIRAVLND